MTCHRPNFLKGYPSQKGTTEAGSKVSVPPPAAARPLKRMKENMYSKGNFYLSS